LRGNHPAFAREIKKPASIDYRLGFTERLQFVDFAGGVNF
jgi:hypothetical protein